MALPTYLTGWAGSEAVIPWVAITHVDDQNTKHTYRYSTVHLGDPLTYHGGRKEARLLDATWTRVCSDKMGAYRVGSFEFVLDDTDQYISRWLGNTYQSKLRGALVELYLVSRTDWLAKAAPSACWTGLLDNVEPSSSEQTIRITASDPVATLLDTSWPDTVVETSRWTNATYNVGAVEPVVFGVWGSAHPVYNGEWPVLFTDDTVTVSGDATWRRSIVCRHQITSIDGIWLTAPDGTSEDIASGISGGNGFLAPGWGSGGTAWPEANSYVDVSSRRYTLIYCNSTRADEIKAGSVLTVSLTSGRCASGLTAVSAAGQLAYFLDNFVFGHQTTAIIAASANTLTNGTYKRDTTTWQEASDAAATDCAWGLREPTTLRDILAGVSLCGDLRLGSNAAGQLCAWEGDATPDIRESHSDRKDLIAGTLSVRQRTVENIHKYTAARDMVSGGSLIGDEERDATSITAHGEMPAQDVDLWAMRDAADASTIVTRRLTRAKLPRNDLSVGVSAAWGQDSVSKDAVGAQTYITHSGAPGGIVGYGDYIMSTLPTAFWRLGEQPEHVVSTAAAVYGNTGTYYGSPELGRKVGPLDDGSTGCLFDGTDDRVQFTAMTGGTTTVTYMFWFRGGTGQATSRGTIIDLGAGSAIYWRDDINYLAINFGADELNDTELTPHVWYHVAISISAGTGTYYINGVADGTFTGYPAHNPVGFGYNITLASHWFVGALKDVVVYNGTALSGGQVLGIYNKRTLDRSAQGVTLGSYVLEQATWNLSTLATTYDLALDVSV